MAPASEEEYDSIQNESETSESKDGSKEMSDEAISNSSDEKTES